MLWDFKFIGIWPQHNRNFGVQETFNLIYLLSVPTSINSINSIFNRWDVDVVDGLRPTDGPIDVEVPAAEFRRRRRKIWSRRKSAEKWIRPAGNPPEKIIRPPPNIFPANFRRQHKSCNDSKEQPHYTPQSLLTDDS